MQAAGGIRFGSAGGEGLDEWERVCVFASFRLSEPHLMTLIVNENSNLWRSLSYLPYETSLISSHTASTSFCGYFKGDGLEVLADLQTHRRSISKQR